MGFVVFFFLILKNINGLVKLFCDAYCVFLY